MKSLLLLLIFIISSTIASALPLKLEHHIQFDNPGNLEFVENVSVFVDANDKLHVFANGLGYAKIFTVKLIDDVYDISDTTLQEIRIRQVLHHYNRIYILDMANKIYSFDHDLADWKTIDHFYTNFADLELMKISFDMYGNILAQMEDYLYTYSLNDDTSNLLYTLVGARSFVASVQEHYIGIYNNQGLSESYSQTEEWKESMIHPSRSIEKSFSMDNYLVYLEYSGPEDNYVSKLYSVHPDTEKILVDTFHVDNIHDFRAIDQLFFYINDDVFSEINYASNEISDYSHFINDSISNEDNIVSFDGVMHYYSVLSKEGHLFLFRRDWGNSVEDQSKVEFNIFPNPAETYLQVDIEKEDIIDIIIYDINGRRIANDLYDYNIDSKLINIEGMKQGRYIVSIITQNHEYKRIFVKE